MDMKTKIIIGICILIFVIFMVNMMMAPAAKKRRK
jgi:hypothetical protein